MQAATGAVPPSSLAGMDKVDGTFWIDEDHRIGGSLELGDDGFQLSLDSPAFESKNFTIGPQGCLAVGSDPGNIADDYVPRVIQGSLENGVILTLLDAHFDGDFIAYPRQRFTGNRYLIGTHVGGMGQVCTGIRWTFNLPEGLVGWLNDQSVSVSGTGLGGLLTAWTNGGRPGLQFEMDSPHALNVANVSVVGAMTQLLTLWTNKAVSVVCTEVRFEGVGWGRYVDGNERGKTVTRTDLLPLNEVSLETFAKWLPSATALEPLPYIASYAASTLQVLAQVATTAIEGLHSRLQNPPQRNFPQVSKGVVERVMKEAATMGANALGDKGYPDVERAKRLMKEALGHIDNPGYRQRATELASEVVKIAPGLCGPNLETWVGYATDIRNEQSHQTLNTFSDSHVTKYFIISVSAPWMLKIRILLEVVSSDRLHLALQQSQGFLFDLASMDLEHHWTDFSCLSTFRSAQPGQG